MFPRVNRVNFLKNNALSVSALLFLLVAGPVPGPAGAGEFPTPATPYQHRGYKGYHCYPTTSPLVIDGRLDEQSWSAARWTDEFVDIEGDLKPAPRFSTRVKMLWDQDFLYVGAWLEEPHVWATLTERDAVIYHDNDFEVFIDPDGDNHLYYELEINALGTVWDLLLIRPYRDGGPAVNAWDIRGFKSAVFVDGTLNDPSDIDRGWSVEIALPWEVLEECAGRPVPPDDQEVWRINFSRVEWRAEVAGGRYRKVTDPATGEPLAEDNWVWSPQGLIAMHYPERWGTVRFHPRGRPHPSPFSTTPTPPWFTAEADALMQCYYRQRQYQAVHGRFALDLTELNFRPGDFPLAGHITLVARPSFFEATIDLGRRFLPHDTLHVSEDGRLWATERTRPPEAPREAPHADD